MSGQQRRQQTALTPTDINNQPNAVQVERLGHGCVPVVGAVAHEGVEQRRLFRPGGEVLEVRLAEDRLEEAGPAPQRLAPGAPGTPVTGRREVARSVMQRGPGVTAQPGRAGSVREPALYIDCEDPEGCQRAAEPEQSLWPYPCLLRQ